MREDRELRGKKVRISLARVIPSWGGTVSGRRKI